MNKATFSLKSVSFITLQFLFSAPKFSVTQAQILKDIYEAPPLSPTPQFNQ